MHSTLVCSQVGDSSLRKAPFAGSRTLAPQGDRVRRGGVQCELSGIINKKTSILLVLSSLAHADTCSSKMHQGKCVVFFPFASLLLRDNNFPPSLRGT